MFFTSEFNYALNFKAFIKTKVKKIKDKFFVIKTKNEIYGNSCIGKMLLPVYDIFKFLAKLYQI